MPRIVILGDACLSSPPLLASPARTPTLSVMPSWPLLPPPLLRDMLLSTPFGVIPNVGVVVSNGVAKPAKGWS